MAELPQGTVTFLFTDIEGSTRLLAALGESYSDALTEHRRLLREAFTSTGGIEVDTQGDAFFVVFTTPQAAIRPPPPNNNSRHIPGPTDRTYGCVWVSTPASRSRTEKVRSDQTCTWVRASVRSPGEARSWSLPRPPR
jgi:class 3 adenylate cyclase